MFLQIPDILPYMLGMRIEAEICPVNRGKGMEALPQGILEGRK